MASTPDCLSEDTGSVYAPLRSALSERPLDVQRPDGAAFENVVSWQHAAPGTQRSGSSPTFSVIEV